MTKHRFATEEIEKFSTVDLIAELKRRYQVLSRPEKSCVILGHPVSGVSTQANFLRKEWGVCSIKREDVLPKPDSNVQEAVLKLAEEIGSFRCRRGFVLQNFPQSEEEARLFDHMLAKKDEKHKEYTPILLSLPSETDEARNSSLKVLKDRASGHMVHEASGRVYNANVTELAPQSPNVDDITGEPLVCPRKNYSQLTEKVERWWSLTQPHMRTYFGERMQVVDSSQSQDEVSMTVSRILLRSAPGKSEASERSSSGNNRQ